MKTTYLIYKQVDGERRLVVATKKEWDDILAQNRLLPSDKRRHFILDCIEDGAELDRIYIEVSEQEQRVWFTSAKRKYRNRKASTAYEHLSLDAEIKSSEVSSLYDCVPASEKADQPLFDKTLLPDLEKALESWNPWAKDLLHLYLDGKRRSSTVWLAMHCGVSVQMARRYKQKFETFVKKFLA